MHSNLESVDLSYSSLQKFISGNIEVNLDYLDFEQPIAELEEKIDQLRRVESDTEINIADEIRRLEEKSNELTQQIFSKLSTAQIAQIARHPKRPYTLDYYSYILETFCELHGDRMYADDAAIVGGLARFDGRPVMVIGQQKGRTTNEKIQRNFAMPRPEGYRKALRLMHLAEHFDLPILTFIDTPGAYPGIGAEERGQSEAIARNLFEMAKLTVPVICTVIGEGGSGGALALGVGDRTLMFQYSTYAVISPEGCASILWKSAARAGDAAQAMGITAARLLDLGLIDRVLEEPLGGAHREPESIANTLKSTLIEELDALCSMPRPKRLQRKAERLRGFGEFTLAND